MNRTAPHSKSTTAPSLEVWERLKLLDENESSGAGRLWSDNTVIEAWQLGYETKERDIVAMLTNQVAANLNYSGELAMQILDPLHKQGMNPLRVYSRLETAFDVDILILVDEKSFVSDAFNGIYELAADLEDRGRSETFRPFVQFMPVGRGQQKSIDTEGLQGDGYTFRLKKLTR